MKSKTLKQFLAEKRKSDVQTSTAVIDTLNTLRSVRNDAYAGSVLIITITDLEGNVLADAGINGEDFNELRPALVEAFCQTLITKFAFAKARCAKMEQLIAKCDPKNPQR